MDFSQCRIMGIVNINDDSFYSESRTPTLEIAQRKIDQLVAEGADIIDIGGISTRPFATPINEAEELRRVVSIIEWTRHAYPKVFISVDTYRAEVARQAIEVGADIINDISAGELDSKMTEVVSNSGLPYIAMHMQGNPQTMQINPQYNNTVEDILDYLLQKKAELNNKGVYQIIWDPGFGFGKNVEHNYQLLSQLSAFHILEGPLLVGVSRKGMIWKPLNITPEESLPGTVAANTIALLQGASILRVHDVQAARQAIEVVNQLYYSQSSKN